MLIANFRLKMKKVDKTTRPFRYDLNQIPYDNTVEVINRFNGLALIDSAWRTMDRGSWHCTGGSDQDHPQGKEMQKGKMVVRGGLTNSWEESEKRRVKEKRSKGVKEKKEDIPIWVHSSKRIARRDKKAFLSNQCKEIEERLEIFSRKWEIQKEHFMQKWAQ